MKKAPNPRPYPLKSNCLLGICRPIAADEPRTARNNHLLTGVKTCVPQRYTVRSRRE